MAAPENFLETQNKQEAENPLAATDRKEKTKKKKKRKFNYDEPVEEDLMPYDADRLLQVDSNQLNTPSNALTPGPNNSNPLMNKTLTSSVLMAPPPLAKIKFQSN